jgi:hypothetical protein
MKKVLKNLNSIMLSRKVDSDSKNKISNLMDSKSIFTRRTLAKAGVTIQPRRRRRRIARLMIELAPKHSSLSDIEYQLLEFQEEI